MNDDARSTELTATLLDATTKIVCASIAMHGHTKEGTPDYIKSVFNTLSEVAGVKAVPAAAEKKSPAVSVGKSVYPDYIVCLEDGKKFKSLKRHLRTDFNMTPDDYRAKWNLPSNYPMVAPNYSEARSKLAKDSGLGKKQKAA